MRASGSVWKAGLLILPCYLNTGLNDSASVIVFALETAIDVPHRLGQINRHFDAVCLLKWKMWAWVHKAATGRLSHHNNVCSNHPHDISSSSVQRTTSYPARLSLPYPGNQFRDSAAIRSQDYFARYIIFSPIDGGEDLQRRSALARFHTSSDENWISWEVAQRIGQWDRAIPSTCHVQQPPMDGTKMEPIGEAELTWYIPNTRSNQTMVSKFLVSKSLPFDVCIGRKTIQQGGILVWGDEFALAQVPAIGNLGDRTYRALPPRNKKEKLNEPTDKLLHKERIRQQEELARKCSLRIILAAQQRHPPADEQPSASKLVGTVPMDLHAEPTVSVTPSTSFASRRTSISEQAGSGDDSDHSASETYEESRSDGRSSYKALSSHLRNYNTRKRSREQAQSISSTDVEDPKLGHTQPSINEHQTWSVARHSIPKSDQREQRPNLTDSLVIMSDRCSSRGHGITLEKAHPVEAVDCEHEQPDRQDDSGDDVNMRPKERSFSNKSRDSTRRPRITAEIPNFDHIQNIIEIDGDESVSAHFSTPVSFVPSWRALDESKESFTPLSTYTQPHVGQDAEGWLIQPLKLEEALKFIPSTTTPDNDYDVQAPRLQDRDTTRW